MLIDPTGHYTESTLNFILSKFGEHAAETGDLAAAQIGAGLAAHYAAGTGGTATILAQQSVSATIQNAVATAFDNALSSLLDTILAGADGSGPVGSPTLLPLAQQLATEVGSGEMTSNEALARFAHAAALASGGDPQQFVDEVGAAFAGFVRAAPFSEVASARPPTNFADDSGFASQYRDGGNQVAHFAGAFVAGDVYGAATGSALNAGREGLQAVRGATGAASLADVQLGHAAAVLGANIANGVVPVFSAPTAIRTGFGTGNFVER